MIGVFDGDTAKMYVNGVLRYKAKSTLKPFGAYDLRIGKYDENTLYPFWFNGKIDEIRFYNRVLNNDEMLFYCSNANPSSVSVIKEEILDFKIHQNVSFF